MHYGVVIERAAGNYSADFPDSPGCVATGQTVEDVTREIAEAINFHIEDMRVRGLPTPQPSSAADCVEAVVPVT